MITRHDIPETIMQLIEKAVEVEIIDSIGIYELAANYQDDWETVAEEIISYAWACRNSEPEKHRSIVPYWDAWVKENNDEQLRIINRI